MARGRRRTAIVSDLTFAQKVSNLTNTCPLSEQSLEIYKSPREELEYFSAKDLVLCSREAFHSISENGNFLNDMNRTLINLEAQENYSSGDDSLPW